VGWYIDTVTVTDAGNYVCYVPSVDLAVSQTASPTSVIVTSNLTYTLSLTNAGTSPASSVMVTDTLPASVTFVSASPGCTYSAGQVTCALGTLANGAATNLTIIVQATASGNLTNIATASTTTADSNPANNTSTLVTTALSLPHLAVTPATLSFGYVAVGQSVTQNWTVANIGQTALSGSAGATTPFSVSSGSPFSLGGGQTGYVAVAFSPSSNSGYTNAVTFTSNGGNATNTVTGSGAFPLAASFSGTPTNGQPPLTVTFIDTSTGTITNRTFDFGDGGSTNTASTNVQHTFLAASTNNVTLTLRGPLGSASLTRTGYIVVTNLAIADLALGLAASADPVAVGNNLTYTLSLTNFGPAAANAVAVTSTLPANVTFVSASSGGTNLGSMVAWQLATLASGARSNLLLVVTPVAAGILTNFVTLAAATADTNSANNSATLVITALAAPIAGFTLTPASGLAPLTVAFTDTSSGVITNRFWDFGDGGTSNTTATGISHVYSVGTNTVTLVVSGPGGSSTNLQAAAVIATNVPSAADIAVSLTATPEPVFSTQLLTYTLSIANLGPQPASNVTVTNALPPQAVFLSAVASQGAWTNYGQSVICNFGALSNGALATLTISVSPSAATNLVSITNLAAGTANESDPNPLNNTAQAVSTVWLDSVGDGIPDWWRAKYFGVGNATNASSCATCDPDGDGFNNLAEFLANTDPTNSASYLALTGISIGSGGLIVNWQGGAAARQFLETRFDLFSTNGSWVDLFTNLPPTPLANSFTNAPGANAAQFFRIRATRP
jgi:uncharacterized repeat protein (TIGR01451 family)